MTIPGASTSHVEQNDASESRVLVVLAAECDSLSSRKTPNNLPITAAMSKIRDSPDRLLG